MTSLSHKSKGNYTNKKLFLHCGAHKTATSLIQANLTKYREELAKNNMYHIHHSALNEEKIIEYSHMPDNQFDSLIKHFFLKLFSQTEATRYLISHESFLSYPIRGMVENSLDFYPDIDHASQKFRNLNIFNNIKILFYIRRQDTFINSLYLQNVQAGYYLHNSFDEFLATINIRAISWKNVIDKLESVFGSENITIKIFEDIADGPLAYFENFLKAIEIENLKVRELRQPLRSFSDLAYQLAKKCYPLLDESERPKLAHFLRQHFSNKDYPPICFISNDLKKEILKYHSDGNRSIFRRYLPEYNENLYSNES